MNSGPRKELGVSNGSPEQSRPEPLENVIATELWRWAFLPPHEQLDVTADRSSLCVTIEFYLCGVFQMIDFTRSRGIWCDGVVELSVSRIDRCAFGIAGVAFCPNRLAPFEIELHFARRRDKEPLRTIIRFGDRHNDGEIRWHRNSTNAPAVLADRPKCNRDWVVAVELTPMET